MTQANSTNIVLRHAVESDVPEIVSLINRAFAVEHFFKSGDRIDETRVRSNMQNGSFLLLCEQQKLVACAWVKLTGNRAYLGTLSVEPSRQKSGLGTWLMKAAEAYARDAGCRALDIRIVNLRTELPRIYRKLGFVETGTETAEPIPSVSQPIHFILMSKAL